MKETEAFTAYLDTLCGQVRCKRARPGLRREVSDHLEDQQAALEEAGMLPEEAEAEAIASMGDPVEVGGRLDRIHRPQMEWGVLIGVILLFVLGCVIEASLESMGGRNVSLDYLLGPLTVGIPLLVVAYFADYALLGRWPRFLFWGFLGLIVTMVYTGYPRDFRGLALLFPLLLGGLIYRWRGAGWQSLVFSFAAFAVGFWALSAFAGVVRGLTVFAACIAVLVAAIWRGWIDVPRWKALLMLLVCILALMLICSGALGIGISYWSQIFKRIFPYLDPGAVSRGYEWNSGCLGVRAVLSESRWVGGINSIPNVGSGEIVVEYALPGVANCVITWVIAHYGWAAGLLVTLVILLVLSRMLWSALHIEAELGRMAALACVLTFTAEAGVYLASNFGLFDLFGGSLPFMDGGWDLIFNLTLAGILLSCYRGKKLLRERVARPARAYPRWLPRLEIKFHPPQYQRGEVPQMLGLAPPPEDSEEE